MKLYSYIVTVLFIVGCSKSDPDPAPPLGTPDTIHHPNDGAKPTSDGTGITLGNTDFKTTARDFSSEPVVTDLKTVSASLVESYSLTSNLEFFRIVGDKVMGVFSENAFDTELIVYSLSQKNKISGHKPDFFLVGFDYNGAIMTVEGSENLNFYKVNESGVISDHFFQVKSFRNSKFLSICYMDDEHAYVYNSDEILQFPIHSTTTVSKLMSIPSFSIINFAADENYLYVAIGDFTSSEIRFVKKSDMKVEKTLTISGRRITGFSVDANYLYVADKNAGKIDVFNKHTQNASGSIGAPSVGAIEVVGNAIYLFRKDTKTLEKHTVSFN